jgi:glucose/arabinose dehydrogenase
LRIRTAVLLASAVTLSTAIRAEAPVQQGERGPNVPAFWVRPGYKVTVVTEAIDKLRFLAFDDKGNLYVSRPERGDILTLRKRGETYDTVAPFIEGKPTVHGMQWADGWLYFTQTGSIHRAKDEDGDGKAEKVETIVAEGSVPHHGGHWWRSVLVSGDSIYTGIGDSGNANDDDANSDPLTRERQKIWRFKKDGTGKALFCGGVRNTEKLMLRPGTDEVWGIEHGTEKIAQSIGETEGHTPISDVHPEEEFNRYVEGGFYGHPYVEGVRFIRPEFASRSDIISLAEKTILPEWTFPAHYAGTGWTFLKKGYFGADHAGDAFIACKGSTGRTAEKVGYCIERVMFDKLTGKPYGSWKVVGTLVDGKVLARPIDCAEAPDGSVYFSDDTTKCIYRISKAGS